MHLFTQYARENSGENRCVGNCEAHAFDTACCAKINSRIFTSDSIGSTIYQPIFLIWLAAASHFREEIGLRLNLWHDYCKQCDYKSLKMTFIQNLFP